MSAVCPSHIAATRNLDLSTAQVEGIAAISPRDVWAVGGIDAKSAAPGRTGSSFGLVEHYNGKNWCLIDTRGWPYSYWGVTATSAGDVWVFGGPTFEHWNGHIWTGVRSPSIPGKSYGPTLVSASSPNNVWVVYVDYQFGTERGNLVERWDGRTWELTLAPAFQPTAYGPSAYPTALATLSATDTWLVGVANVPGPQPWAAHWDGRRWQDTVLPRSAAPVGYSPGLQAACAEPAYKMGQMSVAAINSNDVWAIGNQIDAVSDTCPLAFHWDGVRWQQVWLAATPDDITLLNNTYDTLAPYHNTRAYDWALGAAAAASSNDVWAMANPEDIALHWDGHAWHAVSAFAGPRASQPFDVTSMSVAGSNDIWAIGNVFRPANWNAYHWDGKHWRGVSILPVG